jgi:hypothetical protein
MTRNKIFRDIQNTIAGNPEVEVIAALTAALVVAIGVSAEDRKHAEAAIDELVPDMKGALAEEWSKLRRHRTVSILKHAVEGR